MVLVFGLASILLHVIHAQETHSALIVCEKNTSSIQCDTSIVILSAVYGRTNNSTCPSEFIRTTQCESNTSFAIVNNSCTDRQKCTVYADSRYFGDPCVYTHKYLNVSYQCSADTTTLSSTTKINTARRTTLSSTTNINTAKTTTLFSTTKINTAKTTTTLSLTTKINTDTQNITTDDVKISDISIPAKTTTLSLTTKIDTDVPDKTAQSSDTSTTIGITVGIICSFVFLSGLIALMLFLLRRFRAVERKPTCDNNMVPLDRVSTNDGYTHVLPGINNDISNYSTLDIGHTSNKDGYTDLLSRNDTNAYAYSTIGTGHSLNYESNNHGYMDALP